MKWRVEYYVKKNGRVPVVEHLLALNPKLRAKAQLEIELLEEHGIDLKEPYVKSIRGKRYKGLIKLIQRIKYILATENSEEKRVYQYVF